MKKLLKHSWALYVPDRNHLALYLHASVKSMASSIVFTFTGAWMFSMGLPLHYLLLTYALYFCLMGLTAPLGLRFVMRHGVFKTQLTSNLIMLTGCFAIALVEKNLLYVIPGMALQAFASGLINPVYDVLQAVYVKDEIRGRNYTLMLAISSVAAMIGVALGGWLLTAFSFFAVACLCAMTYVAGSLPFLLLEERIKGTEKVSLKAAYVEPLTPQFRPYFLAFFGEQFSIIGQIVLIPVLTYTLAGSFKTMSFIIVLSIGVQTILMLWFGSWLDRTKSRLPLLGATIGNACAFLFYAFLATTPFALILAETGRRLANNLFTGAFRSAMHGHIRKTKERIIFFGAAWQMSLCFSEFIALSVFAGIALAFGLAALPWLMTICAACMFLAYTQMIKIASRADVHPKVNKVTAELPPPSPNA